MFFLNPLLLTVEALTSETVGVKCGLYDGYLVYLYRHVVCRRRCVRWSEQAVIFV